MSINPYTYKHVILCVCLEIRLYFYVTDNAFYYYYIIIMYFILLGIGKLF